MLLCVIQFDYIHKYRKKERKKERQKERKKEREREKERERKNICQGIYIFLVCLVESLKRLIKIKFLLSKLSLFVCVCVHVGGGENN